MKTSEFIKRIEELGYSYTIENRFIFVDGEIEELENEKDNN